MFPLSITKEEVMQRELGHYKGKIVVAADERSIEQAMAEINQSEIVGFDTEAKPTFQKGQVRNVSLIQVATEDKVFLIRILQTGITDSLHKFFQNEKITKVGIGLTDDFNLLNNLRKFRPTGFLDLNNKFEELDALAASIRNIIKLFSWPPLAVGGSWLKLELSNGIYRGPEKALMTHFLWRYSAAVVYIYRGR